jgi:DNA-binding LytR/AlgR family response regulator
LAGLRTLIVDDEPVARQVLREQLDQLGVNVVGEAENGREACKKIAATHPDLLLVDLEMPGMGGFDLIRSLGDDSPAVIVVTAYSQHGIRAFDAGAVDYLLKPVRIERLGKALARVREVEGERAKADPDPARIAKIVGRSGDEYILLEPGEVLAFQAEGELVWIMTVRERLLATQPLRAIEERFAGRDFRRVHRNAIVNIHHVRKLSALSGQRWLITLSNSAQIVASKRQASSLRRALRV